MNWINAQENKPKEGQKVLMKIVYQRFVGGTHCEDELIITGWIKDGGWFAGKDMLMWDYDFNLGFNDDDVTEWASLDEIAKSS